MRTLIVIRTTFAATHNWPDCNVPGVEYLTKEHRHLFYVTVKFTVFHPDRAIEFIAKKEEIEKYIREKYEHKFLVGTSCEMIAEDLQKQFNATVVGVYEDNENGAEIINNFHS